MKQENKVLHLFKNSTKIGKILLLFGAFFIISLIGIGYCIVDSGVVRFVRVDLPVKNLPDSWQGKKIIQISDIHASRLVSMNYLKRTFERINNEKADAILCSGDFMSGDHTYIEPLKEILSSLKVNLGDSGKIAVLGNHDCGNLKCPLPRGQKPFITAEQREISNTIRSAGFTLLNNKHVEIGESDKISIVGIGEMWARQADPVEALKGLDPARTPVVVLMHNPELFPEIAKIGDFTALAGHVHGGQIVFPFRDKIVITHRKYCSGFYQEKGSVMYVNRGLGASFIPLRFGCPPEVTVFTLVRLVK